MAKRKSKPRMRSEKEKARTRERLRDRQKDLQKYLPVEQTAIRTHAEVAEIMTQRGYKMGGNRVRTIEMQAFKKLASHLAGWL